MPHRFNSAFGWPTAAVVSSLIFFVTCIFADSYPRQVAVDIQNYVFRLELRDDSNEIAGETQIDALFTADGSTELFLDLIGKSADGKTGMSVSSVKGDDRTLRFKHENSRIGISLAIPSKKGTRLRLAISYGGVPADGLIIGPNKYKDRVFFGDNFPNRCRYWLPTVDHPYDKATCEFAITAPEAYQVIANGMLIETTTLPASRRLTRYRESVPIATYCMVIGVARFAVETVGQVAGVPVQTWVYAADHDAGFSDYRIGIKPLEFFIWRIGPFSYEKLANVQSRTRFGGMENASNIFYSERSVSGQGRNEGLFAHEIAHQWFGDSVTASDWDHTWLSEGFATYLTHVYNEYTYGRDVMIRGLRGDRDRIIQYSAKNPTIALVTPANPKLDNILSTNSYQKGGWVLHMLRRQIGEEAFWKGLATYYKRYQNGNVLTEDFQRIMEEASGRALDAFFHQWVYTPGQPRIEGSWSYQDGTMTVELRQSWPGGFVFQTALDIGILAGGDTAPRIQTVQLDQPNQTFVIKLDKEPVNVALDPDTWLLMRLGSFAKK
jgi:aminopeptidase N